SGTPRRLTTYRYSSHISFLTGTHSTRRPADHRPRPNCEAAYWGPCAAGSSPTVVKNSDNHRHGINSITVFIRNSRLEPNGEDPIRKNPPRPAGAETAR